LNSPEVQTRHSIEYGRKSDSYHYVRKIKGQDVLLPCELMGQISADHITIQDIFSHARRAVKKMENLSEFMNKNGKNILQDGMEALRIIDALDYSDAYLLAAAAANSSKTPVTPPSNGRFVSLTHVLQHGQDTNSGWSLPTNVGTVPGPVGYGSAQGFLAIADAVERTPDPATFARTYGFSYELATKAANFIRALQLYVSHLQSFYVHNPALDPLSAAPWLHRPTALHVLWDNVIAPQHRMPYLIWRAGANSGRGSAQAAAGVQPASQEAASYLSDELLGTIAVGAPDVDPAQVQRIQSNINVQFSITAGGNGEAFYVASQRGRTAATTTDDLFKLLPAFAQAAIGSPAKLVTSAGKFRATHVTGDSIVATAYNVLLTLCYGTVLNPGVEQARALVLSIMSLVDLSGARNRDNAETIAKRILGAYAAFVEPVLRLSAKELTAADEDTLRAAMNRATNDAVATNFDTASKSATNAGLVGIKSDAERAAAINRLRALIVQPVQEDGGVYLLSPLVYTPRQLETHGGNGANTGLADPLVPSQYMSETDRTNYANLLSLISTNPDAAARLPPSLRPFDYRIPTTAQGSQMAVLQTLLENNGKRQNRALALTGGAAMTPAGYTAADQEFARLMGRDGRKRGPPAVEQEPRTEAMDTSGSASVGRLDSLYPHIAALVDVPAFRENWAKVDEATNAGLLQQWTAKGMIFFFAPSLT
jgi:hypothetical protein